MTMFFVKQMVYYSRQVWQSRRGLLILSQVAYFITSAAVACVPIVYDFRSTPSHLQHGGWYIYGMSVFAVVTFFSIWYLLTVFTIAFCEGYSRLYLFRQLTAVLDAQSSAFYGLPYLVHTDYLNIVFSRV